MMSQAKPRHKILYVLPNLFTLSSIVLSFAAMTIVSSNPDARDFYRAAMLIFFSTLFDGFDGKVARLTRTQSEFGIQLDSLADVISFGIAPALLIYRWGLEPLGWLGLAGAVLYLCCGALRLARFNVIAARAGGKKNPFFYGVPIPMAAGLLVSLVMVHYVTGLKAVHAHNHILILTVVLSYLMVSNIRYRTFKAYGNSLKARLYMGSMFVLLISIGIRVTPAFMVLSFFSIFIATGLIEELIRAIRPTRPEEEEALPTDLEMTALDGSDEEDDILPDDEPEKREQEV